MAINVTVATADQLSQSENDSFLEITFTNTNAFTYAANSTIYYYALLTDSTPDTPLTREVTFTVEKTTSGTIAASSTQTFYFENTTDLIPTITGSNGKICYMPV